MSALIGLGAALAYVVVGWLTFRAVRVWEFRDAEELYPELYADEAYRRKAWSEFGWALCCGAVWPIGLPEAALLTGRVRLPSRVRSEPPARKDASR